MTEINQISNEIFLVREIFNVFVVISMILFALYLFNKMRKKESGSVQKHIYLGYCFFLLSYGVTRIFFIFSDYEVRSLVYPIIDSPLNMIYVGIAYTFGLFGALWIFFMVERYLVRTRYIFTAITIGILGLSIISILGIVPTDIPQLIMTVALPGFIALIILLYVYVAIKTPGDARNRALGIVVGLLIMVIGFLLGSKLFGGALESLGMLYEVRILIEPFIVIAGAAIFAFSQR